MLRLHRTSKLLVFDGSKVDVFRFSFAATASMFLQSGTVVRRRRRPASPDRRQPRLSCSYRIGVEGVEGEVKIFSVSRCWSMFPTFRCFSDVDVSTKCTVLRGQSESFQTLDVFDFPMFPISQCFRCRGIYGSLFFPRSTRKRKPTKAFVVCSLERLIACKNRYTDQLLYVHIVILYV